MYAECSCCALGKVGIKENNLKKKNRPRPVVPLPSAPTSGTRQRVFFLKKIESKDFFNKKNKKNLCRVPSL